MSSADTHVREPSKRGRRIRLLNWIGCTLLAVLAIVAFFGSGHGHEEHGGQPSTGQVEHDAAVDVDETGAARTPDGESTGVADHETNDSADERTGGVTTTRGDPHVHVLERAEPAPPPLWWLGTIPFLLLLGSIAILPLVRRFQHWWEELHNKLFVALVMGGLTLLYYVIFVGPGSAVLAVGHAVPGEYVPFIVLLFALFAISGGISITGDLRATPFVNTAFLGVGTAIASFIGTTGASMLLIRPLLQTNSERKRKVHTVVFFIFLVSNIGGSLLPIGDPPLFLGFLRGVPFFWTFTLWLPWLAVSTLLLLIYFAWDTVAYRREDARDIAKDERPGAPLRMSGSINLLWLAGVVACVALLDPAKPLPGTEWHPFPFLRELLMLGFAGVSLLTTPSGLREANKFNWFAIQEVAAIFIGIFVAMQVPLEVLKVSGDALGVNEPWQFFWATGVLSSFLDNAPTYLVFFQTAKSVSTGAEGSLIDLASGSVIREDLLVAVSLGAVFMGANTYIGNGPNFMVKAIAEQSGVKMPTFFGYMFFSGLILIPLFVLVTFLFLL